jgi:hypothetical protein
MRRLFLLVSSAISVLLAFASVAAGEPPVKGDFPPTPPRNSGYCSFPVLRSDEGSTTTITKPDGTQIVHIDRLLTFTANGKSLTSNDHFTRFIDPAQPFIVDAAGHVISVEVPGQGAILLEVGRIVFDARNPGVPLFEAGQHSSLDHDTAAFCAYFAA